MGRPDPRVTMAPARIVGIRGGVCAKTVFWLGFTTVRVSILVWYLKFLLIPVSRESDKSFAGNDW